jgi:hypothetical protein
MSIARKVMSFFVQSARTRIGNSVDTTLTRVARRLHSYLHATESLSSAGAARITVAVAVTVAGVGGYRRPRRAFDAFLPSPILFISMNGEVCYLPETFAFASRM